MVIEIVVVGETFTAPFTGENAVAVGATGPPPPPPPAGADVVAVDVAEIPE